MFTAVTDVEADGDRFPLHYCIRLSVIGRTKRKLFIAATELTTENGAESRAAQSESASRTVVLVALPTRLFFLIEPRPSLRLAGRMSRQIDV